MKTIFLIFTLLLLLLSGCSNENTNQESNYEAQKQLAKDSHNTENSHNTSDSANTTSKNNSTNSTSQTSSAPEELSRYATTIYTKTEERQNNVKLCCNQLNGHVVSPGQTFSFCDTLRSGNTRRGLSKS